MIGSGDSIKIREDRWLPRGVLGGPAGHHEPVKVAELIGPERKEWNVQILESMFDEQLVKEVTAIPLTTHTIHDQLVWTATKTGDFIVKSAYNKIREKDQLPPTTQASNSTSVPHQLWNRIWKLQLPPKIKHFLWSVCHNALPTTEKLYKRQILPSPECPLCKQAPETLEHLFLLCPWTDEIWKNQAIQIQISTQGLSRMDIWLHNYLSNSGNLLSFDQIATLLWHIWKTRNNYVFRGTAPIPRPLIEAVQMTNLSLLKTNHQRLNRFSETNHSTPKWSPPERNSLKINIDGAFAESKTEGAIAGVIRDHNGVLLDGFARRAPASSALQMEWLALLEAARFFVSWRAHVIQLQTDCQEIVEILQGRSHVSWEMKPLFDEAETWLAQSPLLTVIHCGRSANQVTDWIAKAQLHHALPNFWLSRPPDILFQLLCTDAKCDNSGFGSMNRFS